MPYRRVDKITSAMLVEASFDSSERGNIMKIAHVALIALLGTSVALPVYAQPGPGRGPGMGIGAGIR